MWTSLQLQDYAKLLGRFRIWALFSFFLFCRLNLNLCGHPIWHDRLAISISRVRLSVIPLSCKDPGKVVHTCASVTKQYNLAPAKRQWCSMDGNVAVCLVSHWLSVNYIVDGKKVKVVIVRKSPLKRSGMDHSFYTANTPYMPRIVTMFLRVTNNLTYLLSPRKRSPNGATTTGSDSSHQIAAYYSFTDLKRMKGWHGLVIADLQRTVYQYKWLPIRYRSGAGQRKFAGQRRTF